MEYMLDWKTGQSIKATHFSKCDLTKTNKMI
jgi:hypothetical protein